MEKFLFADLPPDERRRIMRDHADKVEETTYMKPLSDEELTVRREYLVDNSIDLGKMEDELADTKAEFKRKMDPIKKANKDLLYELKHKQAEVTGTLYHIADRDDRMMGTYDENGELISSRRLRPDEKQLRIPLSKAQ